jgi:hypothetical protein
MVPYMKLPVASLSPLRARFSPTPVYVEFVVGKVVLGQDYPPPFIVPTMLHREGLAH